MRSVNGQAVSKDVVARLWLPPEEVYPMFGGIEVVREGSMLANYLILVEGVAEIYPGDPHSMFKKL